MKKIYIIAVLIIAVALIGGYLYFPLDVAQSQKDHTWALIDNPGGSHPNGQVFKPDEGYIGGITWYCVSPNNQNIEYRLRLYENNPFPTNIYWTHTGSLNVVGGGVPYPVVTSVNFDTSWSDTWAFTVELLEGDPSTGIAGANSDVYADGARWHYPSGGSWTEEPGDDLAFHIFTSAGGSPPIADFYWSPQSPLSGETVYFYDTSSDLDADINQWHWDFGDGTTDTVPDPDHVYQFSGNYNVILTVTDSQGNSDSDVQTISITDDPTETYILNFDVTDSSTSGPIAGATVSVNKNLGERTTNALGRATYNSVEGGSYFYSVFADGYEHASASIIVNSDTTLNVELTPDDNPQPPPDNTSVLTVIVEDSSNNLVMGAFVEIDSSSYSSSGYTDQTGIVYFEDVPYGTYGVRVSYGGMNVESVAIIPGETVVSFVLYGTPGPSVLGLSFGLLISVTVLVICFAIALLKPMPIHFKILLIVLGVAIVLLFFFLGWL